MKLFAQMMMMMMMESKRSIPQIQYLSLLLYKKRCKFSKKTISTTKFYIYTLPITSLLHPAALD